MIKLPSLLSSLLRCIANSSKTRGLKQTINRIKPEFDTDYLTNPANLDHIKANILNRKGVGEIEKVHGLLKEINQTTDAKIRGSLQLQLEAALSTIPNQTHPDVINYGDRPKEISSIGSKRDFDFVARPFDKLCGHLNILRTNEIDNYHGSRSYYFMSDLAEMVSRFVG